MSWIYQGELTHARWWPLRHAFRYPVYLLALDLDELPALAHRLHLFSHNRPNLVALHDRDYQDAAGGLAAALRRHLAAEGAPHDGRIVALTHARVFGYVFNPVSFFYCLDGQGRRAAAVAEVNNTFGDTHRYLLDARNAADDQRYVTDKLIHVSPFMDMRCRYDWRFRGVPGDPELRVDMDVSRKGTPFFAARLTLARRPLTDATLAATLARYPLETLKVTARIHLHALRLWIKGAPFRHHRSQTAFGLRPRPRRHDEDAFQ